MADRTGVFAYAVFLLCLWVLLAAVLLLPGNLKISGIEGDVLHGLDGAARLAAGAIPHLDFSTPLGALSFAALSLPLRLGAGAGEAMLMANLGVAAFLLPGLLLLRATRLGPGLAALLAIWALGEATALVHDSTTTAVTFALHYNRWCWAVFTVIALQLALSSRQPAPAGPEGLVLGLGLAFLAMTKMTYFVALLLPALICVASRRSATLLLVTLGSGAGVAGATTWAVGDAGFWMAYLRDLLFVMTSEVRPKPGLDLADVLGAPVNAIGTTVLFAAVILLRLAGRSHSGLMLFALAPGMILIAHQNWANAPIWLVTVIILVLAESRHVTAGLRVAGFGLRAALGGVAVAATVQVAPFVLNMGGSFLRHLTGEDADYAAALTPPGWDDLRFATTRASLARAQIPIGPGPEEVTHAAQRAAQTPVTFEGRVFPACDLVAGLISRMEARAASVAALPAMAGQPSVTADIINADWMFFGTPPLTSASPWYYGGLSGLEGADWLIVPMCPTSTLARATLLEAITAAGWRFAERHADDELVIYQRIR